MAYQEDLILSIYGRGEPGLAMADPLPKGPDRDKPVQAPGKDGTPSSPYLPGKSPIPSRGLAHHTGGKHFTEPSMDELIKGIITGEIAPGTLGDEETEQRLIQEYMERQGQSMFINQDLANTPQDGPYPDAPRYKGYKETGDDNQLFIRDKFIDKRGKDIFKLFTGIDLAKKKKKRNKALTIYEEAARRDFERDMGYTDEGYGYDPDEIGPLDDLLDGV